MGTTFRTTPSEESLTQPANTDEAEMPGPVAKANPGQSN